jgi:hypothetical protein
MKDRLSQLALGVFLAIIVCGIVVVSLASFIGALHDPVIIAAWIITIALAFLSGLTVWRVTAMKHERETQVIDAQPVTTPQPRLQSSAFVPVDDRTMVRQSQIANAAALVYRNMFPDVPPTRRAIMETFPEMQSAGFVAAVQSYLAKRGRVAGGGQGREYTWVTEEESE